MKPPLEKYLLPTDMLDSDHPAVTQFAERVVGQSGNDPVRSAVRLYYAVRDGIRYDPYVPFHRPDHYRASNILKWRRGYCVGKAALLCAVSRARNIPCRLGFATVRNHLASKKLLAYIGSDRFVYHGYVEFWLNRRWVKATPAFNAELCELHHVDPLDFDGYTDAIYQSYNREKKRYIEYLDDHGAFADVPMDEIVRAWKTAYGERKVQEWIDKNQSQGDSWHSGKDFYRERPVTS